MRKLSCGPLPGARSGAGLCSEEPTKAPSAAAAAIATMAARRPTGSRMTGRSNRGYSIFGCSCGAAANGLRGRRQPDRERAAARASFQVLLEQRVFELGELPVDPERCPLAGTLAATIAR